MLDVSYVAVLKVTAA